ncbi:MULTISPECIES: YqhR family membrane protein [Paenibacillus]|uniref:Membrane protein YqhR n=1 Tax=Paenibacillus pabuli TaxID=1472 RepID=A0A855YFV6_9BACL|nr:MULTISPECIES: YqhR family membrane protein [Paenibacillus]PWW44176.1 membrane protein YqhR [Paenibacillus pabuli]PXW10205.1 membrane protein YqhR [Paenibacillus taichungensis]
MTEYTGERTSHKENGRADKGEEKDRGKRPTQRQGQSHYFTKPFPFAVELGFFAGFIWGGLHWLSYLLHFTIVPLGFLAEPFFKHNFIYTAAGHLTGWLFFIVFSVFTSLIYTFTLRKLKGPIPGMGYGILWWLIIFVLVGPKLDMVKPLNRLTWDSIITEFCFFLLWGLFIGYTVAMEFTDERKREPEKAGA